MRTQKFCSDRFIFSLPSLTCPFLESASPLLCSLPVPVVCCLTTGASWEMCRRVILSLCRHRAVCLHRPSWGSLHCTSVSCAGSSEVCSRQHPTHSGAVPCAAMSQHHRIFPLRYNLTGPLLYTRLSLTETWFWSAWLSFMIFKYILLILLLQLSQFFPLCPPSTWYPPLPPAIPP